MSDEPTRPDPDALLKRVQDAAVREGRARLKIWFGMAPGVGKTYAMLEWAQRTRPEGLVVGWVETHGRRETAALLGGLEILPPRKISYRATELSDFDLEGALARKPKLIILDELAHTNAPGGRHLKRWQDVLDLLDAGIDVHTTLNVQHVESLHDVIREITGVTVRETVPDHILDRADEIELIDLPPDDLLTRLHQGKVYLGEQGARAVENFFRRGNLLALRELALRRTADRVDLDVRAWREAHAIEDAWASNEKLLVCVGDGPGSSEVIRAARRLADRLRAPWVAVHVEAADRPPLPDDARARVDAHMRLAESLGAETMWLSGDRAVDAIVTHARRQHVTRILVGRHQRGRWRWLKHLVRRTFVDLLVRRAADLEVHVVACAPTDERPSTPRERPLIVEYAWSVGAVALTSVVSLLGHDTLAQVDVVMLYLVAIMLVAMRFGRGPSVAASVASVAAYDFFFVPPYLTFAVADLRHILTFATMFAVGLLIGGLTLRLRRQEAAARKREARTSALFTLARDLGAAPDATRVAAAAVHHARAIFDAEATVLAPPVEGSDSRAPLPILARSGDTALDATDMAVARWVADHERPAGLGADALPGARVGCFPLGRDVVMALLPRQPATLCDSESRHFAELFTRQVGIALERARLSERARDASVRAETEEMRSALLSSVSHDLRTPLAAITGAATTLRDEPALPTELRADLVASICDEAGRLEHLVTSLLDMTRLDSGAVTPRREWVPTDELVGATLVRFERALGKRPVAVRILPSVAFLHVDPALFGQLLGNLIENAIKYSPADGPIEIEIGESLRGLEVAVRDSGPGFAPGTEARVFERFYRGDTATGTTRGAGLGLAIARAIAHAHGGEMAAMTRAEGGAIVTCTLPAECAAPTLPDSEEAAALDEATPDVRAELAP